MSIEQTVSAIARLPIEEQLQIVHQIWNRLGSENVSSLTDSQQGELDQRMQKYRKNPESALTEDQLRQKLKERREKL
jgi:putative addiction module component (TIGR02574 family)